MKLSTFSRFFANLGLGLSERKPQRRAKRRPVTKPTLEFLEDRTLLSTSPAAVVTNPNTSPYFASTGFAPTSGFDPQIVMDPTNSQNLVAVYTTGAALGGATSTDGGQSWKTFTYVGTINAGGTTSPGVVLDPTTFNNEVSYADVTSPSVSFDRDGNFYVVSNQFNATALTLESNTTSGANDLGASGAIVLDKFNFAQVVGGAVGAATYETIKNSILYQWEGQDPAYNPTVAVDTNLAATAASGPSFTDPVTGNTQTDTMAVSIDPTTGLAVTAPAAQETYTISSGTINAMATTFTVTDGNGTTVNPPVNAIVTFEDTGEQVQFLSATPTSATGTTWTVTRGVNGTTATQHNNGATLTYSPVAPKGVYVGWNINFTEPEFRGGSPATVSRIMIAASGDGGNNFTTNQYADAAGSGIVVPVFTGNNTIVNIGTGVGAAPEFLFTQGTANSTTVPGGQLNVLYSTITGASATIQQSQPDGGVASQDVAASETFTNSTGGNIAYGNAAGFQTETVFLVDNVNGFNGLHVGDTEADVSFTAGTPLPAAGATVTIDAGQGNAETVTLTSVLMNTPTTATFGFAGTPVTKAHNQGEPITYVIATSGASSQTTDFNLPVSSTLFPADFTTIDDLEVTVGIVAPHMDQMKIVLIPPVGSGLNNITLLDNFENTDGSTNFATGLPDLPNLGVYANPTINPNGQFHTIGTVFDVDAPRNIDAENDNTSTSPWIGHYQPELGGGNGNTNLTEVFGLTPAAVNGTWVLAVTDFINNGNNPPQQFLTDFSMHFTSLISTTGFGTGADTGTGDPGYTENGATQTDSLPGALAGSPSNVYPTALGTGASGTPGAGPGVVAAIDNTLGSFSPFQGRFYIAYTTGTNILMIHSDNDGGAFTATGVQINDDSITDNFSEGTRPEFMPSIAIDPVTGTVVVMYYDGRWDAATARVGNSISYSVNGGESWSTSASMNLEQTATDEITSDTVDVSPVLGNTTSAGAFGFGDRAGLVVYDGDVMPFFGSNLDIAGSEIMTATVTIPSGPTVVSGDMGPIVADSNYTPFVYTDSAYTGPALGSTYGPITYNNTFASDGTRLLSSFELTFDRPIDINSFTASTGLIQVFFRDPEGDAPVQIPVASITPLDNLTAFGPGGVGIGALATQFLINLVTPQFLVGTYSYAIGFNNWALASTITASSTTLMVNSGGLTPPATPFNITLDNEQMTVSATSATNWAILARGVNGTTAAQHNTGDNISTIPVSTDIRSIATGVTLNDQAGLTEQWTLATAMTGAPTPTTTLTVNPVTVTLVNDNNGFNGLHVGDMQATISFTTDTALPGVGASVTIDAGQANAETVTLSSVSQTSATTAIFGFATTPVTNAHNQGEPMTYGPRPPATPFQITIDQETMTVTSVNNVTNVWTVTRGANPQAHAAGANVIFGGDTELDKTTLDMPNGATAGTMVLTVHHYAAERPPAPGALITFADGRTYTILTATAGAADDTWTLTTGLTAGEANGAAVTYTAGAPVLLGSFMNQDQNLITNAKQVEQAPGVNTVTSSTNNTQTDLPSTVTPTLSPTITFTDPYQQVRQDFYDPIQIRVDIGVATTLNTPFALSVALVSPNGTTINLGSATFAVTSNGVRSIIFSDYTPATAPIGVVLHKSVTPLLAALVNENVNGAWQLQITNVSGHDVTLLDWSLTLPVTTNVFAVPTPVNGVPFQFPYSNQTLPLIIPGPHVVSTAVVSGGTYNVPSDIYDQWSLASTIAFNAATLTINTGGPSLPPGPFTILIDGEEMEVSPTSATVWNILARHVNGTLAASHASGAVITYAPNVTVAAGASLNVTTNTTQLVLPVTDAYQVQQSATNQIQVTVRFTAAVAGNVQLLLKAQDGTTVNLGTVMAALGVNTFTFDDFAPTGTVAPATPLATLIGENTAGDWRLAVDNSVAGHAGTVTVTYWTLELPHTTGDNEVLNGTANGILVTFDRAMNPNTFNANNVVQMIGPLGVPIGASGLSSNTNPAFFNVIAGPQLVSQGLIPTALANRVFEVTFPPEVLNGSYSLTLSPSITDTTTQDEGLGNPVDTTFTAGIDQLNGASTTNTVNTVFSQTTSGNQNLLLPPGATVSSAITITQAFQILQQAPETWTLAIQPGTTTLSATATTLTVIAGPTPPPTTQGPFTVLIDNEQLSVTSVVGDVWSVARGQNLTTATMHAVGATVTFAGYHIQAQLDIAPASGSQIQSSDFQAELVAPDGTTIQLFTNVGSTDTNPPTTFTQGFDSTIFDDFASTAIQAGTPPYSDQPGPNGTPATFNPQDPLSALIGKNTAGTWQLVITNTSSGDVGALQKWGLFFPRTTPDTNLGEPQADQISTSFRIFTQDPTNLLSQQQWTPVGPASDNNGANTGPVNAIAVDPSDPSGNTVYVAAASGGLWKTTNFLTTNPLGPTYVPLTNLGPTGSLNISSIAVFGQNNDPTQSVIFAITGNPNNTNPAVPGDVGFPQTLSASAVGNPVDLTGGIGLLWSDTGGRTWTVLDSSHNFYDPANDGGNSSIIDNPLPESATNPIATPAEQAADVVRDDLFVGLVGYKVTVDPTRLPDGNIAVYAAFSSGPNNPNGGLYRSLDAGEDWTLMPTTDSANGGQLDLFQGEAAPIQPGAAFKNATDVVLAAGSGANDPNGNLQTLYAGFQGQGVYGTTAATSATSLSLLAGGGGDGSRQNIDGGVNHPVAVGVSNPPNTPNGANGRIVLAAPSLTSSPLENSFYEGWLYAAVANAAGAGLYVTKDGGANWTQIQLPQITLNAPVYATNNTNDTKIDTLQDPNAFPFNNSNSNTLDNQIQGVINLTLTVDPTNPNIVYLGGGGYNLLRIDISNLADPYAAVPYTNIAPNGGLTQFASTGPASLRASGGAYGIYNQNATNPYAQTEQGPSGSTSYYNLVRDPANLFFNPSTLQMQNVTNINNQGTGVLWGEVGDLTNSAGVSILSGSIDLRALVAIRDPLTGDTRLLVGDDNGVFTGADVGVSAIQSSIGQATVVTGSRNGNLQLADMADSASQPSSLAANIAGALFYGQSQFNNGFPASTSNILATGNLNWSGENNLGSFLGDGTSVATDPGGSGQLYQDRWANKQAINQLSPGGAPLLGTDFFLVTPPGAAITSRTGGAGSHINPTDPNQWPSQGGSRFAVNPVDPTGIVISSQSGSVYQSTNTGSTWTLIGTAGLNGFSGAYGDAMAFGAPPAGLPATSSDKFIYDGNTSGQVWVTFSGGGTSTTVGGAGAASWHNITGAGATGLDGSAVEQIVTDPKAGSHDLYVVTQMGVYYMADSTAATSTWTNVTGNLFSLERSILNNPRVPNDLVTTLKDLTSLAVDWRFAVPTSNTAYAAQTWTLKSALTAGATSLTVTAGGPTPPTTPFFITIGQEVLQVTATNSTTNVWTIMRAQNGTTQAATYAAGTAVTTSGTTPVLYVGGDGGVFRSEDGGTTWTNYPAVTNTWTLTSALTATATTLNVAANGLTPPSTPFTVTIGQEELTATAQTWTLASALTAGATTLTVNPGLIPPTTPFTITIDNEQMVISATSGVTWTISQRGVNGTLAQPHQAAAGVTNDTSWTILRAQDGTTAAAHAASASVTSNGDGAVANGGDLPNMQVTSIQLVTGNIGAQTGLPNESTGYNLLLASTYGQGDFAIRLDNSAVAQYAVSTVSFAGPTVSSIAPVTSSSTTMTGITVTFNTTVPVDPQTVKASDLTVYDPNGNLVAVAAGVFEVNPSSGANVYRFTFVQPQTAAGTYTVTVAGASDSSGDLMTPFSGALLFPISVGEAVADFPVSGPGSGVYIYHSASGFQHIAQANASVLAIDSVGDVAAEFPGYGVYEYTASTGVLAPITAANASVLTMDAAGDVFAEFSGQGVWRYTAATGAWAQLTAGNATLLAADAGGDLFGEFKGYGINEYLVSSGSFVRVNGTDATLLGADAAGDAFAFFPGTGLAKYHGGNWSVVDGAGVSLLAVDAAGDAAVVFPGYGTYRLPAGGNVNSFVQLTANSAESELAMGGPTGDVFAEYPGHGLYRTIGAGAFQQMTLPQSVSLPTQDAAGDVFAQVSGLGIMSYTVAAGWQSLPPIATPSLLAADKAGDVVGEFPGYGVYLHLHTSATWTLLLNNTASLLGIDSVGDVFAVFPQGVYRLPAGGGPGSWVQLTPAVASLMAVDANGDVAADFPGYGIERYTTATGWRSLNTADASLLAIDAAGDIFASLSTGVWRYLNGGAGQLLNGTVANQLAVDAAGDLFVQFRGFNGVYRSTFANPTAFQQIAQTNAALLADDIFGDVLLDFSGEGFYHYAANSGLLLLPGTEGDASVLA